MIDPSATSLTRVKKFKLVREDMGLEFSRLGELPEKLICHGCIGEKYLSTLIESHGKKDTCSYCEESDTACITLVELAERVEKAISVHFCRTSEEPDGYQYAMQRDKELNYEWEREGEPIHDLVTQLLLVDADVTSDLLELLANHHDCRAPGDPDEGEAEFSFSSHYEPKSLSLTFWNQKWDRLEVALKNESRFFNQEVLGVLKSVFADLHHVRSRGHGLAVVKVGPETALPSLYRAREFQTVQALHAALEDPAKELGPPPGQFARAGRMNASGISVFYGAEQSHAAISEVRPVVGSNVAVAKFTIVRPLLLLDLRALETIEIAGSVFDSGFTEERERMGFLRTLTKRLTVPVMPGDQDRDYLTTQAIADYLSGFTEPELDGILFPSVQDGTGVNVVLFHKASMVEPLDISSGATLSASVTDFDYDTYDEYVAYGIRVIKPLPGKADVAPSHRSTNSDDFSAAPITTLLRKPALRLELNSIEVHKVDAVKVKTTPHRVNISYQNPIIWKDDRF
jgi:hypothetical protein